MNRRYGIIIGIIGVFVLFALNRQDTPEDRAIISTPVKVASIPQAEEERPEPIPVRVSRLISESEAKNLRNTFPDTNDVRKEVEENPHGTPPSLLKFANTLGPMVEKAMKNPADADFLVDVLGDCVSSDTVIVSARTVCLTKAEQIAKAYPELRSEVVDIRKNAGKDVTQLSGRMNSYLRKE